MTTPAKGIPALPGPYSVAEAINRLITVAASQVGYHEGRSSGGSWNNDTTYGAWYGMNGVAWCAIFVSWCADKAGFTSIIPKHAYTPSGWSWFVARNRDVASPRRGDIMYVYGPVSGESKPRVHHVGIVEQVLPDGRIRSLEGNTNLNGSASGDGVYRLTRTVSSRLKFARPDYAKVVKPRPPAAKPPKPVVMPRTGGTPKKDPQGRQILDLHILVLAAKVPVATHLTWAQRHAAAGSLKHPNLKCMSPSEPVTRETFKAAWKRWQKKLGYEGADADGIPGVESFSRFIEKTGRSKKSSGYKPR